LRYTKNRDDPASPATIRTIWAIVYLTYSLAAFSD